MQLPISSAKRPMRVLCLMDLSCVGRAGLSVVLPVLSACGVQACGLPTALFSTHTGGFGSTEKRDMSSFGEGALEHYAREGVDFDCVYAGYLYGASQFALAERAMEQYPNALHVVDPALGDNGKAYSGISGESIERMRKLCLLGDLITPNYTESAMLAGLPLTNSPMGDAGAAQRLEALTLGKRAVLITSVPTLSGGFVTHGKTARSGMFTVQNQRWPQHYPGTGDMFCAACIGLMLRHSWPLEKAVRRATSFIEKAVEYTYHNGGTPRDGLCFEPLLSSMLGEQTCLGTAMPAKE